MTESYPAGLVIEGHGRTSVFRSPLWGSLPPPGSPVPKPAPVLEVHRHDFRVTLRNLVLDGRKFEQVPPGTGSWFSWLYGGLYVWNSGPWLDEVKEIQGDSLGDNDGYCDVEGNPVQTSPVRIACVEAATGNDGDGKCEAGENCVDDSGEDWTCDEEAWTNAPACESAKDADDGCVHNVVVRDIPGAHAILIDHANRWIIEDSEIHDVGCVNRGFGFDCSHFESALDATVPAGFKTFGVGLNVSAYTADFHVRRNKVRRTTKYGLSFDNIKGTCNGLLRNHEVTDNQISDIGSVAIFNYGTVGARIHDNTIQRTTTWPPSRAERPPRPVRDEPRSSSG